jgi:EpsI family protein
MKKQFWISVLFLLIAIVYLRFYTTIEAVPLPADIENFPKKIGAFTMSGSSEFSEDVLRELGVSSYINRDYKDKDGYKLSLYLGYYEEQKEGAMIHSPKHCMPGSGWAPIESSVMPVSLAATSKQSHKINRIVFQKGMDKLIMYYWYQGRNRIVANEYIDRIYLILDSLFKKRTEGSLVRVIGPWDPTIDFEQKQEQFIASLFTVLQQHLPQ